MKLSPPFNKYLIFADESGDHVLQPHNPEFTVFALVFCIVERGHYADYIVPNLLKLKMKYFQDEHVIFHENEIRRRINDFSFLMGNHAKEQFLKDLRCFMETAEFTIIAAIIDKIKLQNIYTSPRNPYDIAIELCLQQSLRFLDDEQQKLPTTVTIEARAPHQDKELKQSFSRITNHRSYKAHIGGERFKLKIIPKEFNNYGLQLADLIARPIALSVMRPNQGNRAYNLIKDKIHRKNGLIENAGLILFPDKRKPL